MKITTAMREKIVDLVAPLSPLALFMEFADTSPGLSCKYLHLPETWDALGQSFRLYLCKEESAGRLVKIREHFYSPEEIREVLTAEKEK